MTREIGFNLRIFTDRPGTHGAVNPWDMPIDYGEDGPMGNKNQDGYFRCR
jgi:hypothetical protein